MGSDSVLIDLVSLEPRWEQCWSWRPSGNTGTAGVAREVATTAAVAVVASVEAMVTDAASGEPQEDDGDGDKTTIYQHGVCQWVVYC